MPSQLPLLFLRNAAIGAATASYRALFYRWWDVFVVLRDQLPDGPRQPFWSRPLTKRQTLLAYFAVGWVAVFAMMFIGDYELTHHLPSLSDMLGYAVVALLLGPFFAWVAKWKSAGLRKFVSKDVDDPE